MNICFINFNKNWGGVKTWTIDFGKALQEYGHSITAVVRSETPFETECRKAGFSVHAFCPGMKYNPINIFKTVKILKSTKTDICIVNIGKGYKHRCSRIKTLRNPVVRRVGLPQDIRSNFEENILRKLTNAVIVPSNKLKDQIKDLPYMKGLEIYVLPNSKKPELYSHTGSNSKDITIGVTSQLSITKGHQHLITAFKTLIDKGLNIRLKIAGKGGAYEMELKEMVSELGLDEKIEFCGFTRDIPGFLSELDIFVLPSITENFPNTLVEALFAGLPCISTDTGGIPEAIADTGILVPVKDAKSLSDAMEKLILSEELRNELGAKAKARALANFDLTENSKKLELIFTEIISL